MLRKQEVHFSEFFKKKIRKLGLKIGNQVILASLVH